MKLPLQRQAGGHCPWWAQHYRLALAPPAWASEPVLWAYPLGSQVLHWGVSLEEFEQALGSGGSLLCEGALAAPAGRGGAGGLLPGSWQRLERTEENAGPSNHLCAGSHHLAGSTWPGRAGGHASAWSTTHWPCPPSPGVPRQAGHHWEALSMRAGPGEKPREASSCASLVHGCSAQFWGHCPRSSLWGVGPAQPVGMAAGGSCPDCPRLPASDWLQLGLSGERNQDAMEQAPGAVQPERTSPGPSLHSCPAFVGATRWHRRQSLLRCPPRLPTE